MSVRSASLSLVFAALLAGGARADTITVGSKIDTEGALLGNMIALVLRRDGLTVESRIGLGPTNIVRSAILAGADRHLSGIYRQRRALLRDGNRSGVEERGRGLCDGEASRPRAERARLARARARQQHLGHRGEQGRWRRSTASDARRFRALCRAAAAGCGSRPRRSSSRIRWRPAGLRDAPIASPSRRDQLLVLAGGDTAATIRAAAEGISGVNAGMAYGTDGALAALGLVVLADDKGRGDRLCAGAGRARSDARGPSRNRGPARSGVPLADARAAAAPQCRDRGRWQRRRDRWRSTISRRTGLPRDERGRTRPARRTSCCCLLLVLGDGGAGGDRLRRACAEPPGLGHAAVAVARRGRGARDDCRRRHRRCFCWRHRSCRRRRGRCCSRRSLPPARCCCCCSRRAGRCSGGRWPRHRRRAARTDARAGLLDRRALRRPRHSRRAAAARGRAAAAGRRRGGLDRGAGRGAGGERAARCLVARARICGAPRRLPRRAGAALRAGARRARAGARHRRAAGRAGGAAPRRRRVRSSPRSTSFRRSPRSRCSGC